MKEISGYLCGFCGKFYIRKHNCEHHETRCKRNPENFRACFGCTHCQKIYQSVSFDTPFGQQEEKRGVLYCKAKGLFVYPPKVERNLFGRGYELGLENIPMPKTCDIRKDILPGYD